MKRIIVLILSLCMVLALLSAAAIVSSADVEVTVGQQLFYNKTDKENFSVWRQSNLSPDGMWKYMFYVPNKNAYGDMKYAKEGTCFSWNGTYGTGKAPLDYIFVRDFGLNFHPGPGGDVCKVFVVPVSGHITLETSVSRANEFTEKSSGTPTGIAVWLEDQQLYPTGGAAYESLTTVEPRVFTVETDVVKGQYLYIRINAIDGDNGSDAVNMENFVTYSAISADNDDDITFSRTELTKKVWTGGSTVTIPDLTDKNTDRVTGVVASNEPGGSSSRTGLIIGIAAAVVVIAAAVAAVVIVKKKKSN